MVDTPPRSYPVRREMRRLRRWFETAGAEYRLVASVCPSPSLRAEVAQGLSGDGGLRSVELEIAQGDLIPASFREHRGNHATFMFFVFSGLAERVEREGMAALDALENAAELFRRPATWALLWLEDPALPALLARRAPRFWALTQIHPSFPDRDFERSDGPGGPRSRLAEAMRPRTPVAPAPPQRAWQRVEGGDLLALRRLLRDGTDDPESGLFLEAECALLGGDAQLALAHFAAAASLGQPRGAEARAALADLLARLGDAEGARARADAVLADPRASPAARVRALASLARIARERAQPEGARDALADTLAVCEKDPVALRLLARAALEQADPGLAIEALAGAVAAAAGEPATAELSRADMGLLLARAGESAEPEARELLVPLAERAEPLARVRAIRGLARLELERAARALAVPDRAQAEAHLGAAETALAEGSTLARAHGLAHEVFEAGLERVAVAAVREDLDAVLAALSVVEVEMRAAGLRPLLFEVLERKARALRFANAPAAANATLDELENLAYDLTYPDLERRAFEARAEQLDALEIPGEARVARNRADEIAAALGGDGHGGR